MLPTHVGRTIALSGVILFVAAALGCPATAVANDFRVDNRIFPGNATAPQSQGTTIFHEGLVIDFFGSPAEVVIFDPPGRKGEGRFVLLDTGRQLVTELTTKEVAEFDQQVGRRLQEKSLAQPEPLLQFLADPRFQEKFEAKTAELTLASPWMTYTVRLAAADDQAMIAQYHEFSDWYARLNSMLNPGSRPPFARLVLNEAIANHRALPSEVALTFVAKSPGGTPTTLRVQHQLIPRLSQADLDAVAAVQRNLRAFKPVRFAEYQKRD